VSEWRLPLSFQLLFFASCVARVSVTRVLDIEARDNDGPQFLQCYCIEFLTLILLFLLL